MAQLVDLLTLAQIMISQFVSSSPVSGSVLTAQSLEPASDSVSPPLSLRPSLACTQQSLSLCVSEINKHFFKMSVHSTKSIPPSLSLYLEGHCCVCFLRVLQGSSVYLHMCFIIEMPQLPSQLHKAVSFPSTALKFRI